VGRVLTGRRSDGVAERLGELVDHWRHDLDHDGIDKRNHLEVVYEAPEEFPSGSRSDDERATTRNGLAELENESHDNLPFGGRDGFRSGNPIVMYRTYKNATV
jgi:hypothetical protein